MGTTVAALNNSVTMTACTLAPGLSFSPGFSASTQTCTVVLAGSVAGLTTITLPGTTSPLST